MRTRSSSVLRPRAGALRALACFSLAAAAGTATCAELPQFLELYNETVCYVNNERISKRDVEERIDFAIMARLYEFRERLMAEGKWNEEAQQKYNELLLPDFRRALKDLVKEKLMLQEARELKVEVDKVDFRKRVDRQLAELKSRGLLGKSRYSTHEVQQRLHEQMLLEEFQGQLVNALDLPNKRDVEGYYKQHLEEYQRPPTVKLRVIKVNRRKTDSTGKTVLVEDALAQAEGMRKDVAEYGRRFEDLAREKSDDEESRARGGLLAGRDGDSYVDPEQYRSLAPVVRKLKPGAGAESVSDVFQVDERCWGFVMLEDRRVAGPAPLDGPLYQKIYEQLVREVVVRKETEWFKKALQKSLILDGQANPKPIPMRFFFPDDPALAEPGAAKKAEPPKKTEPSKKDQAPPARKER